MTGPADVSGPADVTGPADMSGPADLSDVGRPSAPAALPAAQEDLAALLRAAAARLAAAGVASPRADAEQLAAHVLGLSRGELLAASCRGHVLPAGPARTFAELIAVRAQRVPLQHLTGRAPFRELLLRVGPGVFVPRPETELAAQLAVDEAARLAALPRPAGLPGPLVVDLCTGSGAIALAVATEVPQVRVVAVELEEDAHAWAQANLAELDPQAAARVRLLRGDAVDAHRGVLADLAGQVDVVVANPPYIPARAVPVDPEVAEHDPRQALYGGGEDGLDVPRGVIRAAAGLLVPGGLLVMEHADTQGPSTRALAAGPVWEGARTVEDLTGRPRVLVARRAGAAGRGARRDG
ncbi:MAG TPA: peptide chain release factor N(5)-glutamine methyltransferase [Kineosporiaceae bacterium]|nr:peptide chain release factor N(5)-glutamine methyltransferase [Kineosporiaceae bacterium]